MKTSTNEPNVIAWTHTLGSLSERYGAEVVRLTDLYRDRILAGEFSGAEDDGPRCLRLERELSRHPFARRLGDAIAVMACSRWPQSRGNSVELSSAAVTRSSAAECLAQDVLAEAVRRGWLRRRGERWPVAKARRTA